MPTLTVYRHYPITGPESPTYLGDWRSTTTHESPLPDDYLWLEIMSGSDYSGNALEKSNHDVFLEQFGAVDGVLDVYGGYGTYGVLIRRDVYESNVEIQERLAALDSYPVLDEDHMSQVETTAQDEAWESWACSDFRRALRSRFPALEDAIENIPPAELRDFFESECNAQNVYWENETGNSAWIDVEDVAKDVDESALELLATAHAE